jgi:UDP:flavonoid glycosyltransferase YjiC (YdhE family)
MKRRPNLVDLPYEMTIYATFGTVFSRPDNFAPLRAAVADLEVNVIVTTVPTVAPAGLGATPEHVVVRRFVPQGLNSSADALRRYPTPDQARCWGP